MGNLETAYACSQMYYVLKHGLNLLFQPRRIACGKRDLMNWLVDDFEKHDHDQADAHRAAAKEHQAA